MATTPPDDKPEGTPQKKDDNPQIPASLEGTQLEKLVEKLHGKTVTITITLHIH